LTSDSAARLARAPASAPALLRHQRAPTIALGFAAALLAVSLLLPYWRLTLVTPEHPQGLQLHSHLGRLEGEAGAVLALGGGPGAARLAELAELERSVATCGVAMACMLVVAAIFVRNRWAALLTLPAVVFPAIVVADTAHWLRSLLDDAAVTAAPGPPVWQLFGRLASDQMVLETRIGSGLLVAIAASLAVIAGLWLHRDSYRQQA
jgi:hypothetical protein